MLKSFLTFPLVGVFEQQKNSTFLEVADWDYIQAAKKLSYNFFCIAAEITYFENI